MSKLLKSPLPLLAFLLCLVAFPAAGDWLITTQGKMIETDGPWTVDDDLVIFVDTDGNERRLELDEVDLEASEETTAMKAGRAYRAKAAAKSKTAKAETADAESDDPKITLYMTTWCGYCRKATKLLEELDADFVTKDIEKDSKAAAEFRTKSGGRSGVPLIDFDGEIVRGYSDSTIRKLVEKIQKEEASDA